MKTKLLIAVALALNTIAFVGCTSTSADGTKQIDPVLTQTNIDLVIDAVEAYAAVVITDKVTYNNLITRAEQIRRLNDLPQAQRLLASLSGKATTQPSK